MNKAIVIGRLVEDPKIGQSSNQETKIAWIKIAVPRKKRKGQEQTADFIRRGYDLSVFEKAVASLLAINVNIVVHVIIGLPDEGLKEILETINYINSLSVNGIKLQLLHILRDTDLAEYYLDKSNNFHLLSLEEYAYILGECVNHLRPDIVVHRLTGDGPKKDLIAPLWSADKKRVLNYINKYFKDNNIVQGRKYSNGS